MSDGSHNDSTDRLVCLSGCSGGGKSALLAELERRGAAIVEEPGRRVIAEARVRAGRALPWIDLAAFARRALELARQDHAWALGVAGCVFFDRGLVDAAAALEHATGEPALRDIEGLRYNACVFVTPPWPEIYSQDADRQHSFAEAVAEYDRLLEAFAALGYEVEVLPKVSVSKRADLVIGRLKQG